MKTYCDPLILWGPLSFGAQLPAGPKIFIHTHDRDTIEYFVGLFGKVIQLRDHL